SHDGRPSRRRPGLVLGRVGEDGRQVLALLVGQLDVAGGLRPCGGDLLIGTQHAVDGGGHAAALSSRSSTVRSDSFSASQKLANRAGEHACRAPVSNWDRYWKEQPASFANPMRLWPASLRR